MGPHDFRERLLALLMVALVLGAAFPAALALAGEGGGPRPAGWSGSDDGHMWPMFGRDASHSGRADAFERGIANPGIKWERSVTTQCIGTVIGNFSGNVMEENASFTWHDELHCAVYSTANQVHLVEGMDGDDVWLLNITGTFSAAPALGDVDGDGRTDVIMATRTGVLYAYEPIIRWNGTRFTWWGNNSLREQLWNTTADPVGAVTASSVVLDDLNSNGTDELLVGSSQGVFCLNARYGNELWNRTVSGASISTPAVYQVGAQRNVVATSLNTTASPDRLHVYTLRGTSGSLIRSVSMELTTVTGTLLPAINFMPSPVTADLDGQGDGDELIIIQPYRDSIGRIMVFSDGNLAWNSMACNKSLGGSGDLRRIALATPVVGDLDGDGNLDVVVTSHKPYVAPLSTQVYTNISVFKGASGVRGWSTNIDDTIGIDLEWAISSPVLVDADEDDVLDVLLVQYNGRMSAMSGANGSRLWDITTRGYPASLVTTSPAVGDLDLDGFPEVVVNSQAVGFLLPDLEVEPDDITLTDPKPEEGEQVGIDVLVHNRGNDDASDVLVSVYDNDVLAGNATIDNIVAGSSYSARVNHAFYGRVQHTLRVTIDPLDEIEELRKDNNEAEKEVAIVSRYGLRIDCENDVAIISPGTTWHFFCEVTNLGENVNRIRVTSSTAPQDWTVTIDPVTFTLTPAGTSSDSTIVDVEVSTDHAAPAGEYPVTVTATSLNETRNNDSVEVTTVIRGQYGIFLSPGEARGSVAAGKSVVYKFIATNIGNAVDSFSVDVVIPNPDPDWGVNFAPSQITALDPDGTEEISVSVSAPFEAGEGEGFTVFLNVESLSEPSSYDEARIVTAVVIPDLAVLGIEYLRGDGSKVDGSTKRLVSGEDSTIVARLTNLRSNTDITDVRVRFTIDGVPNDVTLKELPAEGATRVDFVRRFTVIGTHSVRVTVDPFEVISDSDRSNNVASGTVVVKSPDPVGPFEVTGVVYTYDNVTPVPGATVHITVTETAYSFTVVADGLGHYSASIPNNRYEDGDQVVLNATDGRDFAEETLHAYSEDGSAVHDLTLSEGVHYDVTWFVGPVGIDVRTGQAVQTNVSLVHTGTRDTTVDLSVQSDGWGPRLLYPNGTPVQSLLLMEGTVEDLVLAFDVPANAEGDTAMVFRLLAVPREDPDVQDQLNMTATVVVERAIELDVVSSPSGPAHPGDARRHNITVTNSGNVDEVVDLSFDRNFLAWCVTFDVDPVPVPAFDQVLIRVTLAVPDYAGAGEHSIAVTGVSQDDETVVANTHLPETVEALEYGVSIEATDTSTSGKPGETVWWRLEVENMGNVRDTYGLTVFGLGTDYVHRFKVDDSSASEITLAPGAKETVIFEVDVPESFTNIPSPDLDVTVKAGSINEATALDNVVLQLELKGILDLSIAVSTSTNSPKVGKRVTFTVTVENLGPDDAAGVYVYAFFGDETEKKSAGDVAANDEKDITLEWYPDKEGSFQVRIVVNPSGEAGAIWEIDYDNNEWEQPMSVSTPEGDSFLQSGLFWIVLIIMVVVVIVALAMLGGRSGEEEAAEVEVVEDDEEYDDGSVDEEEGAEDDYDDGEEYEDEGYGDGYDDEALDEEEPGDDWDEGEEDLVEEGEEDLVEEEEEETAVPFTVGRM